MVSTWGSCLISTYSAAAIAACSPIYQPENLCLGTMSDFLCLAFAKIAHVLNMMHLQFLKILFSPQLFAFFNCQPAKSQQDLTVSMTAASSHFLWHNINHCRIPAGFILPLKVPLAFSIRSSPFFLISLVLLFSSVQGMCCITQWWQLKSELCSDSLGLFDSQCLL